MTLYRNKYQVIHASHDNHMTLYRNEGMRNRLDLHGLHVTEALEALKEKLNQTAAGKLTHPKGY